MSFSSPLRWSDLDGASVGVWGVGVEGAATLARLAALGLAPRAIVDDSPSTPDVVATASGGLEQLARCEVVIKAPGISRYSGEVMALEQAGVRVVGGLGLWLEEVGPTSVIGITGTKGKSTTVSVAGHLAAGLGVRAMVGGNLGTVPWHPEVPSDVELWIIEVSSYQATDLWSSPAVCAVTSLHSDHLNWHRGLDAYIEDKLSLCGRKGARITIANGDDPWLRDRGDLLQPGPRWISIGGEQGGWATPLGLRGRHNLRNALIAAACLEEMGVPGVGDRQRLARAAEGYRSLPHRLETIAVVDGVEYVDDSLSTNVLPTIAAAEVFEGRPMVLLVGGFDREIDYEPLADFAVSRGASTLVYTLPDNGERIRAAMNRAGVEARPCETIREAVQHAAASISSGGVVLLSPAAPSFGVYRSYKERAEAFRVAVEELSDA